MTDTTSGSPTHIIIDEKLGEAFVPVAENRLLAVSIATGETLRSVVLPAGSHPNVLVPRAGSTSSTTTTTTR